ncbi:MAG: DeoR/GlpR transcriptional regulator [Chloroflexi bacterium]|jgi:DeoR/GlpR family transcriptional regulator of sugar metabolism|nr:DeoR/GlpR transcriptional regulator [Chloroflexota bacterium]
MTTHERRQTLIELLRRQPGMRVPEIAAMLDVSEGTVRNDLNALEADGRLERVHGGAVLAERMHIDSTSFTERHRENVIAKEAVARQAAKLVQDGDSILLDASSTIYYLGLALETRQRLRVVTNGLDVARLLAKNPSNTVILIGGILSQDGSSLTGLFSEQAIQDLHVQKAFVSASGFTIERGLTEVHLEEAQLKRKAIQTAQQVIALMDSNKLGHEDLTPVAHPTQLASLYTDSEISPEWVHKINEAGIKLVVCGLE